MKTISEMQDEITAAELAERVLTFVKIGLGAAIMVCVGYAALKTWAIHAATTCGAC